MSIINTSISDDITKDDDKLSFRVQNSFRYEFDTQNDEYITGFNGRPAAVVMGNVGELKTRLIEGYVLKKVGSEDISIEVSLGVDGTPFHVRNVTMEYYIQTLSDTDSTNGGDSGGTIDPILDGGRDPLISQ